MIVSNFELLIKKLAPPNVIEPFNRRVVQGYFLTITNLEARNISLKLRITVADGTANRAINLITNNVVCAYDVSPRDNGRLSLISVATATPSVKIFQTDSIEIPSKQTALIVVLPNTELITNTTPNPALEIRGFIEVIQSSISFLSFPKFYEAEVLLTPEHRGTFLDNDFGRIPVPSTATEMDFDQLAYALPIASGKAQNNIERPEIVFYPFPIDQIPDRFADFNQELFTALNKHHMGKEEIKDAIHEIRKFIKH
jgi:hypothetical protein